MRECATMGNSLFANWGLNRVIKVSGRGSVADELWEALRNLMMVVIEGIEKLEKECLVCVGVGSGLQGGSLDSIVDILLSKNWSKTLIHLSFNLQTNSNIYTMYIS